MNGKTTKAKPKMDDVTRPKKSAAKSAGSDQLIIQSRPIIGRATSLGSSSESDEQTPVDPAIEPSTTTAPVLPSQSKRTLIVPITDASEKEAKEPAPVKDAASAETATAPEAPKEQSEPAEDTPKEDKDAASPESPADDKVTETKRSAGDAKEAKSEAADTADDKSGTSEDTADDAAEDDSDDEDDKADKKDGKPSAQTQKAVEEAAAAAKRDKELETFIDSHQFFVPINAVAHKRSVKHSALMTFVVFLLALVLIDLMLDSGLILLVQKIPHTHFFTITSIGQ